MRLDLTLPIGSKNRRKYSEAIKAFKTFNKEYEPYFWHTKENRLIGYPVTR